MRSTWLRILGGSIALMAFAACSAGSDDDAALAATPNADDSVQVPTCGNFRTEYPEKCDDGNLSNGNGCNASCTGP